MSRVEEYVAARVNLYNSLFDHGADAEKDRDRHRTEATRIWATLKPPDRRSAETSYHAAIIIEARKHAK